MKHLILISTIFFLISCGGNQFNTDPSGDGKVFNVVESDIFDLRLDNLVCNPFQEGDVSSSHGLKASLYSVEKDTVEDLNGFLNFGDKSKQTIYFSNLNIPTRKFSLGFPTVTGEKIKNDKGVVIDEWFALSIESELKLGVNDDEGWYEIAILSDDGSRVSVKDESGNYKVIIDNDRAHETKMGCASNRLYFSKSTKLPIKIEYFQGPRYHISLMPLMRKVSSNTKTERYCGVKGNSLFFDSDNNSAPQPAFREILARGWQTMSPDNWGIPGADGGNINPCAKGESLTMSGLAVDTNTDKNKITVSWTTDKSSSSQVVFKNLRTGKEFYKNSGKNLTKNHSVSLTITNRVDEFEVQAFSITPELGKAISSPTKAPL